MEHDLLHEIRPSSATGLSNGNPDRMKPFAKRLDLDFTIRRCGRPRKTNNSKSEPSAGNSWALSPFRQAVSCSSNPCSAIIISRILNFWILPVTVCGKLSTNLT